MRRLFRHARALTRRCITGANGDPDIDRRIALQVQLLCDAVERLLEIFLDIVAQRLERRHVENLHAVGQLAFQTALKKHVDGGIECSKRLTAAGRRGYKCMPPCPDLRPRLDLCLRRLSETRLEPRTAGRMKIRKTSAVGRRCDAHG